MGHIAHQGHHASKATWPTSQNTAPLLGLNMRNECLKYSGKIHPRILPEPPSYKPDYSLVREFLG